MPEHSKQPAEAPVIWLLTDNKPGHRSQLKGLGNRLRVLAGASLHWVDASLTKVPFWRVLLTRPPPLQDPELPDPDLIIAAGSSTHRLLLALRKFKKARTLVMMKPDFPVRLISAAMIPAHDRVPPSSRVLVTEGVVNAITPLARITEKQEALVLLGGPSPHFDWKDDAILEQLSELISRYPDWGWTISSSRRTPRALQDRLDQLAGSRVAVVHPEQTYQDWLSHKLAASRAVWVTPDSMSMVCEAATSGVPTGLFEIPAKAGSRVAEGVGRLRKGGYVALFRDHSRVMSGNVTRADTLWEANRAALWVLEQGLLPHHHKPVQRQSREAKL
ncbi:mitochondrial fission ELM1 family protein [Marinobacter halotolerans]|uniref:mitochondrial fission ELM1 family protein n=1 Tax=Marinobacter halotolerans TaxID=1569211 RepID=UPI001248D3FD|nr:ELM1/GtrOC1 family putative glycosyltransferase [Marinobacter halotolerans]